MIKSLFTRIAMCLVVALTLIQSGCGKPQPKFRIGVSQCSDDAWRSQMNDEIRREMLFHDDAEVEIRISDDDNDRQIKDIDYFIDNGFDIIIVSPREANAITPVIKKAYDKGIPVIVFDRAINGDYYTSYIELDNYGIGRAAAEYAVHALGEGPAEIIEIRGLDDSSPAADRHRGFSNVIDSTRDKTVVASVTAGWNEAPAYELTDSLLARHPDVKLVYAHNDVMALGASKALKKHGRNDVLVLGTDAAPALGISAVADSMIDATFIYPTEGERVIRKAMAILNGESYSRVEHVPAQYAVDRSNADILLKQNKLIADKTHQIEMLKDSNDLILSRHHAQSNFLYAVATAAVLLIIALILLIRNLRQRNRYEQRLTEKNRQLSEERDRQSELYARLEEATHSKLVFFTNVSHDLRTPLTLISEPVEQVAEAGYLTDTHKSMMRIALRNVKILRRMIEQILDFRRYQNGQTELNLQEACLPVLISEWSDSFQGLAARRRISFSIDTSEARPDFHMATDVNKMERVFFNLLSNAFKYTPDGGEIKVKCSAGPTIFTMKVSDSGIGIPEDETDRIFDRFHQVDKVHPNGSGIGLSLSKAFVELMGGDISVTSKPGNGATFTVSLPISHVEDGDAEVWKTMNASTSGNTGNAEQFEEADIAELEPLEKENRPLDEERPLVLAIDDNPDMTSLLQDILSEDYNIITASNGKSGLRLAMKYTPDLIICDIMMPGTDGLECCRRLKEETSTSHIPILILTACRLDEQRVQSYDSGADGFISKPFDGKLLLSRCRNLLLNRQRIYDLYAAGDSGTEISSSRRLPDVNDTNAMESEFYGKFLSIVMERYAESELSVKDIAEKLGIGATQLTRKIKALTHLSPVDIIRNIRLRKARQLLLTTEKSISEIAYEVGFSSPQYFSKCFRDMYSKSPTEFRL